MHAIEEKITLLCKISTPKMLLRNSTHVYGADGAGDTCRMLGRFRHHCAVPGSYSGALWFWYGLRSVVL